MCCWFQVLFPRLAAPKLIAAPFVWLFPAMWARPYRNRHNGRTAANMHVNKERCAVMRHLTMCLLHAFVALSYFVTGTLF